VSQFVQHTMINVVHQAGNNSQQGTNNFHIKQSFNYYSQSMLFKSTDCLLTRVGESQKPNHSSK